MAEGHIKSVAVFCGSRPGNNPVFMEEAAALGRLLAENGYEIYYGGGSAGLMGAVANAHLEAARETAGVKTHAVNIHIFENQGVSPKGVDEIHVDNMLDRKSYMLGLVGASIILPGGFGTLDEATEALVEDDIMKHHDSNGVLKPVIFVNTPINGEGYFDDVLRQLEKSLRFEFTSASMGRFYGDVPDARSVMSLLERLNRQGPVLAGDAQTTLLRPEFAVSELSVNGNGHHPQMLYELGK